MGVSYYKEKFEPIDGKWYITQKLGSGAFGTVLEVERRDHTNMKAAVKIVSIPTTSSYVESYREENYDLDEESISTYFYGFVEEFTKEIQLMSELRGCSNIVAIEDYDVKKSSDGIGWDIFIRMELLKPMNQHYRENTPKAKDAIKLGIDICKALEACQEYKIIHRDIKPSNIFVSRNGDYKLGDFGVSRTLEKTVSGLSKKGTYTYMAPEVFKGEAYNSNVDIYSLGIVMYKLLNNNLEPFRKERTYSDEQNSLLLRLKGETIPKPANADGRLAEIVLKACSFNSKERYENPAQMRNELEAIFYNENKETIIQMANTELEVEVSEKPSEHITQINEEIISTDEKTVSMFGMFAVTEVDDYKANGNVDKTTKNESDVVSNDNQENVPVVVDEEQKNTTYRKAPINKTEFGNTACKRSNVDVCLFKDIDNYDEELKKMRENDPKNQITRSVEGAVSGSGGTFRRIDEYDEELKRMKREEITKKQKGKRSIVRW